MQSSKLALYSSSSPWACLELASTTTRAAYVRTAVSVSSDYEQPPWKQQHLKQIALTACS